MADRRLDLLLANVSTRSDAEGFELQSPGNRLRLNRAVGNGTWGFDENRSPPANRYEDNFCDGNGSGGSGPAPETLCSPQPREVSERITAGAGAASAEDGP